jgi:uncharacterized membrane protein
MYWYHYLFINLFAAVIRENLNKKLADKTSPFVSLFFVTLSNGILLYIAQFFIYKSLPKFDFWLALGGGFFVFGYLAYYSALKFSLSQSILFSSYSILVTVILTGIFLGEGRFFDIRTTEGIRVISGISLAFIGLWYLLHTGRKSEEKMESRWFVGIFFTILFFGVGSFFSLFFLKKFSSLDVLLNQTTLMIPLFLVLALYKGKKIRVKKEILPTIGINSLFSVIAVLAFFEGLKLAPAAKFYPIQQVSLVLLTMISGVIFFKEVKVFSGKKLVGMTVGLIGIIMLAVG